MEIFPCTARDVPAHLAADAVRHASEHVPENAVRVSRLAAMGVTSPQHIALLLDKSWGTAGVHLPVKFLDTTNTTLKNKILAYANKWNNWAEVKFTESSSTDGVRLSLGSGGYWSYLGTDIKAIPAAEQTMNLEGFTTSTPDSEYDRVVCHEFGHTLGWPHEHERQEVLALLDVERTVAWFAANVGWDRQTVMEQVFTALNPKSIRATAADVRSIMCYQFPGACTKSGQDIPGGNLIDPTDGAFAASVYPKVTAPPPPPPPPPPGPGPGTGTGLGAGNLQLSVDVSPPHGLSGGTFTFTPKGGKTDNPLAAVNELAILGDLFAIYSAIRGHDPAQVLAALVKLLQDLGIKLPGGLTF